MKTEGKFESWVDVPGTDSRYQISNIGRLRMVGRKTLHSRKAVVMMKVAIKTLVCDYKTGRFGWWVWFDNEKRFFSRDELMELFPPNFRDIDTSADEAAVERRKATFSAEIDGRSKKAEAAECGQQDAES